ncbi:7176_t:CDS:2, partial [Racocetra fulgida]
RDFWSKMRKNCQSLRSPEIINVIIHNQQTKSEEVHEIDAAHAKLLDYVEENPTPEKSAQIVSELAKKLTKCTQFEILKLQAEKKQTQKDILIPESEEPSSFKMADLADGGATFKKKNAK